MKGKSTAQRDNIDDIQAYKGMDWDDTAETVLFQDQNQRQGSKCHHQTVQRK